MNRISNCMESEVGGGGVAPAVSVPFFVSAFIWRLKWNHFYEFQLCYFPSPLSF